jgi:hypothetical protein
VPASRLARADAERRRGLAWSARVAGASWEEVAKVAGYAHASNAARAIKRWRAELPEPEFEELRAVARRRSEQLWQQSWKAVMEGRPGAVTAAVRVLGRIAALEGTDAPTRLDVSSEEKVTAIFAWLGEPADAKTPPPWALAPRPPELTA